MPLRQQPQPEILHHVGVLIFVDQDVAEPPVILGQHIRMLPEDVHHVQHQIAEIGRVELLQSVLVVAI